MKFIKIILAVVIVVPMALVAFLAFAPGQVDFSVYQGNVEKFIKSKSGFDVSLGENVKMTLLPYPYLKAENVRVKAFNGDKDIFAAKTLELEASLKDLFRAKLGIKKLLVEDPVVYLHSDLDKVANWQNKRVKRTGGKTDLSFISGLGDVVISNANFTFEDDLTGKQFKLQDGQIALQTENVETAKLNASALLNGEHFDADFVLDLNRLSSIRTNGNVNFTDNHFQIDGTVYDILYDVSYEGSFALNGSNPLSAIYGVAGVAPSQRIINTPLNVAGDVNVQSHLIEFKNVNVAIEKETGSEQVDTLLTAQVSGLYEKGKNSRVKDKITLKVESLDALDLTFMNTCQAHEPSGSSKVEWSEDIIDFTLLNFIEADIRIDLAKGFICKGTNFDSFNVYATLNDRRLDLRQLQLNKGEGRIQASGYINTKALQPLGMLNLKTEKFDVANLGSEKLNKRMDAPLDVLASLEFVGKTQKEWVNSLKGDVKVYSDSLYLQGLDAKNLQQLILSLFGLTSGNQSTEGNGKLELHASVKDGLARISDSKLLLPQSEILFDGKVDLQRLTMNVKATPTSLEVLGFKVPVNVKGNLFKPSVLPDASATGAVVGTAIGGPAGALIGGTLGKIVSNVGISNDASKTEEDLLIEKQQLEQTIKNFLNN